MTLRTTYVRSLSRQLAAPALLACTMLAACTSKEKSASGAVADTSTASHDLSLTPDQLQRIHLVTVQTQSYRPTLEATGTVGFNGDHSTQVLSPVSGPAVNIVAQPGMRVARGAPLAYVSSPDFAAAVANYRKAQTAFRNSKRIADRDSALFKNDAIARGDLEQAQADASAAEADLEAAIQAMRSLGVEDSQIEAVRLGKTAQLEAIIRSPIDGTVVEKLINPGQLLQAGSTPCFTVADLRTMWVMASVFAEDLKDVAVGQPADVITDASTAPIPARVDYVAALVDPASKAVSVRILAPNNNLLLRKDMFVRVAIKSAHEHSGILVPTSSVLRDEQNLPFVFVAVSNNAFARRRIDVVSRVADRYAISSGLNPGDRVVADGALFLQFAETQ